MKNSRRCLSLICERSHILQFGTWVRETNTKIWNGEITDQADIVYPIHSVKNRRILMRCITKNAEPGFRSGDLYRATGPSATDWHVSWKLGCLWIYSYRTNPHRRRNGEGKLTMQPGGGGSSIRAPRPSFSSSVNRHLSSYLSETDSIFTLNILTFYLLSWASEFSHYIMALYTQLGVVEVYKNR